MKVLKYVSIYLISGECLQVLWFNFPGTNLNKMNRFPRKPWTFAYAKTKAQSQRCSNCEADQRLCFCLTDSTMTSF